MSSTYSEVYYHFVWATHRRVDQIKPEIQARLYDYIVAKSREMGVQILAVGGVEDHVHLACIIPPRLSLAGYMQRIKGASVHYINHGGFGHLAIAWQPGYGVLSFAREQVPVVVNYIRNQRQHHATGNIRPRLERIDDTDPLPNKNRQIYDTSVSNAG